MEAVLDNTQSNAETQIQSDFAKEAIDGLSADEKNLPCKYFYDAKGSELFDQICELDEYYITRTELGLLDNIKAELAEIIGENAVIIEPGAGAGVKIQTLLSCLHRPKTYVPIEISQEFLDYSEEKIRAQFPQLEIIPIRSDFTADIYWRNDQQHNNRIIFFPGSTIGNFSPLEASELLANFAELSGDDGAIIIGFDLFKEAEKIEPAYNDSQGVTAAFNLNILERMNRELGANFNLNDFAHDAFFNAKEERIEMHIKSLKSQTVAIDGHEFQFDEGERIHTENSYKYSNERFLELAAKAGLVSRSHWMDASQQVAIHYLTHAKTPD